MQSDLFVASQVIIPGGELSATAVRASGPGGQNVNKVSTKVELRFDMRRTNVLDSAAKGRLRSLMERIPVKVVLDERVALKGAAVRAAALEMP